MTPAAYLTISVDDGHPADRRSAELLSKYGLKATFYIPRNNPERETLPESGIREISSAFEVGGHTYGHTPLCGIAEDEVRREVRDGKNWMEQLTGKEITAFCYPRGKFSIAAARAVKESGFQGARTCMYNLNDFPADPFLWGLSTHAYPHPRIIQVRHAIMEKNFKGLMNYFRVHKSSVDWVTHFKLAVEYVRLKGGIAHLYFHSWEIDAMQGWERLEDLFRYLAQFKDMARVTNGELFAMYYNRKREP
jgi:peptidoglycan/xylan/chitin deacetylase (PgdA/CDA1 family)